jgi:hypothetical protein
MISSQYQYPMRFIIKNDMIIKKHKINKPIASVKVMASCLLAGTDWYYSQGKLISDSYLFSAKLIIPFAITSLF